MNNNKLDDVFRTNKGESIEAQVSRLICELSPAYAKNPDLIDVDDYTFDFMAEVVHKALAEEREATQAAPVGYLAATELSRLAAGYDATLRSARFGPSYIDGDVPVFLGHAAPKDEVSE